MKLRPFLYLQVADELENDILSERKTPGQKLPPIREMAALYKVNSNTIQSVLRELKEKNFITGHSTSGLYVVTDTEFITTYKTKKAKFIIRSSLRQMKILGYEKEQICSLSTHTTQ